MSITINGTTGITLPSGSAAVGTTDTQTLTNKTVGSGYGGSVLTSGTAQATTSGTAIDFTGIPSWAKRITVMFNSVSTNGASLVQVQIGSGAIQTTGYFSSAALAINGVATTASMSTTGIVWPGAAATVFRTGFIVLSLLGSNTWISSLAGANTEAADGGSGGGTVTLSGTLDRLRLTTVNGTDTFDAGSVNILFE